MEELARVCRGLQSVILSECPQVTGAALEALARGCPGLKTLGLYGCGQVTGAAVEALSGGCPGLHTVYLGRCPQVTDAAVEALVRGCPGLQSVDLDGCEQVTGAELPTFFLLLFWTPCIVSSFHACIRCKPTITSCEDQRAIVTSTETEQVTEGGWRRCPRVMR